MPEGPRFFGRRRGKTLRVTGRTLVDTLLPRLAVAEPLPGEHIDPTRLFEPPAKALWLEVGFGGGEHLAWQAAHHPDIGLIGGEVFLNGIASLLGHIDRDGLTNVRIFAEDVRRLFPAMPDACLDRVFVLFPDPWPKKRHAERRFIGKDNLDQLSRLMADGAELRIATDDEVYKDWAQSQMALRPDFENVTVDRSQKVEDWPATRYETKAREQGRSPIFLRYLRRARSPKL
ncbi:tRNA (guanine(46)-N(7))-methyltransferase TrmB [Telmatospirillum sp.]|uniref:tRNA (guanine(46)-N(7))-methyltransferase TrmB n=1 Tax=Telmatospirillum sp. TaxID=2079197 RepID=UPI00386E478C